jgi:hypothetical protein
MRLRLPSGRYEHMRHARMLDGAAPGPRDDDRMGSPAGSRGRAGPMRGDRGRAGCDRGKGAHSATPSAPDARGGARSVTPSPADEGGAVMTPPPLRPAKRRRPAGKAHTDRRTPQPAHRPVAERRAAVEALLSGMARDPPKLAREARRAILRAKHRISAGGRPGPNLAT